MDIGRDWVVGGRDSDIGDVQAGGVVSEGGGALAGPGGIQIFVLAVQRAVAVPAIVAQFDVGRAVQAGNRHGLRLAV